MRANVKKMSLAAGVLVAMAALAGCNEPMQVSGSPEAASQPAGHKSEYMAKSALKKDASGETAVDSALAWAERYSQASKKIESLQAENRDLVQKNAAAGVQLMKMQTELAAAQKELKEANSMLVEMRQELDKWKSDVLGFRQEMRASQKAQMESMERVLKVLGAEAVTTQPAAATATKGSGL